MKTFRRCRRVLAAPLVFSLVLVLWLFAEAREARRRRTLGAAYEGADE